MSQKKPETGKTAAGANSSAGKGASKTSAKKTETKKRETVAHARETDPVQDKPERESTGGRSRSSGGKSKSSSAEKSKSSSTEKSKSGKRAGDRGSESRTRSKKTDTAPAASERMLHQAMPYILAVLTLFLAACYLFHDSAGKVGVLGGWIYSLFTGLFGWPAFLLPTVLINLAVFWRKYVDMRLVGIKLVLSFTAILFVSSLVQVTMVNEIGEAVYSIATFWKQGNGLLIGGGVLGGLLGNACYQVIGYVGSMIVLIPSIVILAMFLLGVTPHYLYVRLREWWDDGADGRAAAREERRERDAERREERRERTAERRAEEQERREQLEREKYARRAREKHEAEMAAAAAASAAAASQSFGEELTPHKGGKPHQNDFIDLEPAAKGRQGGRAHQNDFIDLEPAAKGRQGGKRDTLDFGKNADLDEILAGNERVARNSHRESVHPDIPLRPSEEETVSTAAHTAPRRSTPADDLAMAMAADKEGRGVEDRASMPGTAQADAHTPAARRAGVRNDHALTAPGEDAPAAPVSEDPLSGLTGLAPVRRKKADNPYAGELEKDPDFYDLNNIFNLHTTPEQEMKNRADEAESELEITLNPIVDEEPPVTPDLGDTAPTPAAPRARRVRTGAVGQTGAAAGAGGAAAAEAGASGGKGPVMTDASGAPLEEEEPEREYVFPSIDFLAMDTSPKDEDITEELRENARRLMETLTDFNVRIKEITYSRGPTITRYELRPDAGIRVRTIANLVDDIALSLATSGVRIEAPIPNKPAVGVEVPNRNRATVYLRDLIDSEKFSGEKSRLTAALGMDVAGKPVYFDISKMPHLLIAGATGMGKSVCINSLIVSMLYKARPDEVRLILIDPKKVEFNIYREIPLLYTPIVIDAKRAAATLACAVAEMERRFELIERVGVRDIKGYNEATAGDPEMEHLPHIVIIIDELAELMMVARDQVETSICRIAQKARAAGMHLIIGTQRPSVDVITGVLKANIPSRIACTVASQVDSRTIIDIAGAEKLIGRGDMLFYPVGAAKPQRVQGAFVSEGEVETIVDFVRKSNSKVRYNRAFIENIEAEAARAEAGKGKDDDEEGGSDGGDSLFENAVRVAVENNKISTSLLQRKLSIGYGKAAKLIDRMEELGYVSEADGNKPRRILITKEMFLELVTNGTLEG